MRAGDGEDAVHIIVGIAPVACFVFAAVQLTVLMHDNCASAKLSTLDRTEAKPYPTFASSAVMGSWVVCQAQPIP